MKYYADNTTPEARVYNDCGQLVALVEKTESYDCLRRDLLLAGLMGESETLIVYVSSQPVLSVFA